MIHARNLLILLTLLWASVQSVFANPIYYEYLDLGAGRYEYNYTVDNQTTSPIEEFTVWFDLGLYDNLLITGSPSFDWEGLEAQPDPLLPDDGFADWLTFGAVINPGELLGGFTVEFDWLGSGSPGSQFFEIIDPLSFTALSSGFTQIALTETPASVPEPDTWLLMIIGLVLLGIVRSRKQPIVESKTAVLGSFALLALPFTTSAAVTDLTATDQQLVSKQRAGRFYFDYTYTLNVNNTAEPMTNVVATVTSTSSNTTIIDGEVVLGDLSGGDTISTDTFTFRQNRRQPFDTSALIWSFSGDAVVVGDNAPVIITTAPTQGSVDTSYTYDVDATDADAGDTLTYSLSTAPASMTIDATTGEIQWTPTNSGSVDVDLLVTDSTGLTDRQIFLVTVNLGENDQAPSLAPIADQSTIVGQPLQVQVSATDPEGETIRYSLLNAPAGMAINPTTGLIQWTPDSAQTGSASATVSASDPGLQSASTSFSLTVLSEESNQPPTITPVGDQSIDAGTAFSLTLVASDPDANEILSFSLSGAPGGLQFDALSGSIKWTPTSNSIGSHPVIATVTDSAGAQASTSFTINVNGAQEPPVAVDDSYILSQREDLVVNDPGVLANDTDANNDPLSAIQMSSPTIGTLSSFPGDGSFTYSPPDIPPMTIGLQLQCSQLRSGYAKGFAVGDIDADGQVEVLGTPSGYTVTLLDGATCNTESTASPGAGEDIGEFVPHTTATLVNLDNDADLEIVIPYGRWSPLVPVDGDPETLMALNWDGTPVWSTATRLSEQPSVQSESNQDQVAGPVPVDLDGDGRVELVQALSAYTPGGATRAAVVAYDGPTGSVLWEYTGPTQQSSGWPSVPRNPIIADLDLDGELEIILTHNVLSADGSLKFLLPVDTHPNGYRYHLTLAVANFDDDPYAEIIAYDQYSHYMFEHTGAIKWQIPRESGSTRVYSLITVAQLDEDTPPEYVVMRPGGVNVGAGWSLYGYDTDGSELWNQADLGLSIENGTLPRGTVPVAFDFDRDGIDELVMQHPGGEGGGAPDYGLYIFSGEDGSIIASDTSVRSDSSSGEPLTIADVDGDGAAEIMVNAYLGPGNSEVRIYEGLAGNPFPAARPIRNQSNYQPNLVNTDGSIPAYPKPHWLTPGLNKFFATPVIPGESSVDVDAFTYVANDGTSDSNEAVVDVTLAMVNAPNLVSTATEGASPGFTYEYAALATDADFGDTLTWTLVDAPAGMTVNQFGIISWQPQAADLGTTRVQLVVTDSSGNTASQTFSINVQPSVTVPNLLGSPQTAVSDTLDTSGLAVGNVTESFSLTVPAGQVLSQSVSGGSESAAGAQIDYVVSLGPQPIFVPNLENLSVAVAETELVDLGLALGSVSFINDQETPKGLILSQSIAQGTDVTVGTSVDMVVSGGPALSVFLSSNLIGEGESITLEIEAFDNSGTATALPGDLTIGVDADPTATGALPSANGSAITTGLDTNGVYTLQVASASLGISLSEDFLVSTVNGVDGVQAAHSVFSRQYNLAIRLINRINTALIDGDLVTVSALATELQNLRDTIDLVGLSRTPAVVLETGYFPATLPGVPTSADASFDASLPPVEAAIRDSRMFLELLNQSATRNDDVRARFLNDSLEAAINGLNLNNLTRRGTMAHAADLYRLLSVEVPKLLVADLDRLLSSLAAEGLLVTNFATPAEFYAARTLPGSARDVEVKPTTFSLAGLITASAVRSNIKSKIYDPLLKTTKLNAKSIVIENLARDSFGARDISGIITGASQSFHSFAADYPIIEAYSSLFHTDGYVVHLIGPPAFNDMEHILQRLRSSNQGGMAEALEHVKQLREQSTSMVVNAQEGYNTITASSVENGCFFDPAPDCRQLLFSQRLPTVHVDGVFPASVVIVVQDLITGEFSVGDFIFFPHREE